MHTAFPVNIAAGGEAIDRLFWLAFSLTAGTFLLVVGLLGWCLWRYRARAGRRAWYTHGDSRGALGLTLGLALAVFFFIDVNLAYHDHQAWDIVWGDPPQAHEALRVQIMPEQFAWNIRYAGPDGRFRTADDITTLNQLHVPVDEPVLVQLTSKDVIHSFFLPNARIKMDAVPGLVTGLYFKARVPGVYDIACAEHCGLGHYRMRGELTVESPTQFDAWLAAQAQDSSGDVAWGWDWETRQPWPQVATQETAHE